MLAYIAFECVVLAIGTAAVPSGGVIMATTLFTVLGFPLEIVAIVAGAYKIIDGIHTCLLYTSSQNRYRNTTR